MQIQKKGIVLKSSQDSSEDSSESKENDASTPYDVTLNNIKLPDSEDRKGKIVILDSLATKDKEQWIKWSKKKQVTHIC